MASGGPPGKRKRGDRTYADDTSRDGSRPSPHRPENLSLAQQGQGHSSPQAYNHSYNRDGLSPSRGRGRGGPRGGGGRGYSRNSYNTPNSTSYTQNSQNSRPENSGSANATAARQPTPQSQAAPPPDAQPASSGAAASTQTPSQPTPSTQPPPEPRFYPYTHVTEDARSKWADGGRQGVVDAGVRYRAEDDMLNMAMLYEEIVLAGLDGYLEPEEAGSVIRSILESIQEAESTMMKPEPAEDSFILPWDAADYFVDTLHSLLPEDVKSARLKSLLVATNVPPQTLRLIMDADMLVQLGLVRSTFPQKAIRHQTNALYRQSNYNLLREETEGYSKLVTELFTTSTSEPATPEVVTRTFERVKALIGTFDLDVGRVLDVHLDVFASILVKHYRFVVKYLRVTSWWPQPSPLEKNQPAETSRRNLPKWAAPDAPDTAVLTDDEKAAVSEARTQRDIAFWDRVRDKGMNAFFELGGCAASPETLEAAIRETREDLVDDREWIEQTGTLPPRGNKVAAQVLGFKLRYYASDAREPGENAPHNLIALAALLIKIGFISLADLYPHIWPEDEMMDAVKERKTQEKEEAERKKLPGGGKLNALQKAGVLCTDPDPPAWARGAFRALEAKLVAKPIVAEVKEFSTPESKEAGEAAHDPREPVDQKIQLLRSLLCIGAIPESLFILSKFPWIMDLFPEVSEHLHRLLHHSLHRVYEPLRPLTAHPELREPAALVDLDQSGVAKGTLRYIQQPARRVLRWAQLDKSDPCEEADYRFYWDDWTDNVPVCQTVDDVFELCRTLLNFSGLKIGLDPLLLAKLTRIGIRSLADDPSEANRRRWADLCKRILVPALSLTSHNSPAVAEVWALLKHFLIPVRYNIYAEWFTGQTSRYPELLAPFNSAKLKTKDLFKRLSKANIKQKARQLAKLATSSPGIVFEVALGQIEAYENLSTIFIDCARYFSDLGYDVLTWSLLNALGSSQRDRTKTDGLHNKKWLIALANFAGGVFKRYAIMNPTPVLHYVTHQLRKGNPSDLIVLEQITLSMAGIVSDSTFNDAQAIGMAGGPLLRKQMMLQLLDRRYEPGIHTSSKRLMRALAGPKLAGQLLVALAQERQVCIFKEDKHTGIKVMGNIFDEMHRITTQCLDLLRANLSFREFDAQVPPLASLIAEYGLEPSIAFWICRPGIEAEMHEHDKKHAAEQERKAAADKEASARATEKKSAETKSQDVEMTDAVATPDASKDAPTEAERGDVEMAEGTAAPEGANTPLPPPGDTTPKEEQYPWHPVLRSTMDSLRPALPAGTLDHLSEAFYLSFWQLSLGELMVPTKEYQQEEDRQNRKLGEIDRSNGDSKTKQHDKKGVEDVKARLGAEFKARVQAFQSNRKRLMLEKDFWFPRSDNAEAACLALFQHCFLPRLTLSSVDAHFVYRMLKLLHSMGTKNFRTVKVLDELFHPKRMSSLMFTFTNNEAENFGRFLHELLKLLASWHSDKAVYEKEAHGAKQNLCGFRKTAKDDSPLIDHDEYRQLLQKWHTSLHTAFKTCFSGGEATHIRNAINILKSVVTVFPAIDWMGKQLAKSLEELSSRMNMRRDEMTAATALLGPLKRREKDWVMVQAFSINKARAGAGTRNGRTATPQPVSTGEGKALNPQAPSFAPSTTSATAPPKISTPVSARTEVEDGEIPSSAKLAPLVNPFPRLTSASNAAGAKASTGGPQRSSTPKARAEEPIKSSGAPASEQVTDSAPPEKRKLADLPALQSQVNRPSPNRNLSDTHVNGRVSHSLPNRPEPVPISMPRPEHRPYEAPYDRTRDHRDALYKDGRRSDWNTGGYNREGHSERPYGRGFPQDRMPADRDRHDPKWSSNQPGQRNAGPDNRFGLHHDQRPPHAGDARTEQRGRDDGPLGRPSDPPLHASRNPPLHADRPPLAGPSQNSDRALGSGHSDRRTDQSRPDGNAHPGSQRGSRAPSPIRRDERQMPGSARDERPPHDNRRPYDDGPTRPRYDDRPPPSGPRPDPRGGMADSVHAAKAPTQSGPHHNYSRGRGPHDSGSFRQPQESSYGRLNPPDTPSVPRAPNGHSGAARPVRGGGPAIQSQVNMPSGPSSSAMQPPNHFNGRPPAPSGPAAGRNTRGSGPFTNPPPTQSSAPPNPVSASSEAPGVHPDRLKAIGEVQGGAPASARGAQAPPAATAGSRGPASTGAGAASNGPAERKDRRFQELKNTVEGTSPNLRNRPAPAGRASNGPPAAPSGPPRRDLAHDQPGYPPPRGNEPGPSHQPPPSRADLFENRVTGNSSYPPSRDDERGRVPGRELRSSRPHHSRSPQRRMSGPSPAQAGGQSGPGYPREEPQRPMPRVRASGDDLRDPHGLPPSRNFSGPPTMGERNGDGGRRPDLRGGGGPGGPGGPAHRDDGPPGPGLGPGFVKDRGERRDSRSDRRGGGPGWASDEHERGPPPQRHEHRREEYESGEPGMKRHRGADDGYERGKRSRR